MPATKQIVNFTGIDLPTEVALLASWSPYKKRVFIRNPGD